MSKINKSGKIKSTLNTSISKIKLLSTNKIDVFAENIVNAVREPLLVLDKDLRVLKASKSFYNFFRVTPVETIGHLIYDLGNKQWNIPKLRELLETILPEKTTFDDYEVEHDFSSIGKRVMLLNARQINRVFGKKKIILLAIEDITERKYKETSLRETNRMTSEYLDILLNHAHVPIIIWDSNFIITRFNHAFEKLSGYNGSEVIDKRIEFLFPAHKIKSTLNSIKNISDEKVEVIEVEILTKTKESKTVLWNSANVFDKQDKKVVATIAQDITERKRSEEKLQESEERYRAFFESSMDAILLTSPDGKILSANQAACKMFGYSESELIQLNKSGRSTLVDGTTDPQLAVVLSERTLNGKAYGELSFIRKDGTSFPSEISSAVFKNHEGIERASMVIRDVTERKKAEQKIRESDKRFRAIFDQASIAIAIIDMSGHPLISNLQLSKMIGYTNDELSKMIFSDFTHPDDIINDIILFTDLNEGKISNYSIEKRYLHKNGDLIWGRYFVTMLRDETGMPGEILVMIEDISERKAAENKIAMLAHSLKSINECVSITNMEDKIIFVNEAFLKTYGYSESDLIGNHISMVQSKKNDSELIKNIFSDTMSGGWEGELWNNKKDGSEFLVYLSTTIIKDKENKTLGLVGIAKDITQFKQNEKELINAKERAEQSDRLKSEFLSQISHEIRTPLHAIVGNVDYLSELFNDNKNQEINSCFDGIGIASKRIIRTIELIINVAQLETSGYNMHFAKFDLNGEILVDLIGDYRLIAARKGIEIIETCQEKTSEVFGDKYSIAQILANVVDNAIKFTKNGSVEIVLGRTKNGRIMVEIKDTGIGISKEFLSRIFEPFAQEEQGYSRSYEGNGLGLALVKRYCELNDIVIEIESKKNIGSTFRIYFNNQITGMDN